MISEIATKIAIQKFDIFLCDDLSHRILYYFVV